MFAYHASHPYGLVAGLHVEMGCFMKVNLIISNMRTKAYN